MGVKNLWQALKPYVREGHVSHFKGKIVGIDMYVWIHRAVLGAVVLRDEKIAEIFERKFGGGRGAQDCGAETGESAASDGTATTADSTSGHSIREHQQHRSIPNNTSSSSTNANSPGSDDNTPASYSSAAADSHAGGFTEEELAALTLDDLATFKDKLLEDVLKKVEVLQRHGIIPYCVFDGREMPIKARTDAEREHNRRAALAKAFAHLSELYHTHHRYQAPARGDTRWLAHASPHYAEAVHCVEKSVDITTELAHVVLVLLRDHKRLHCLVSPYEADAQLAFLCREGRLHAVVSEDSDLILYYCPTVISKLDFYTGRCEVINPPDAVPRFYRDLCAKNNADGARPASASSNSGGAVFTYESFLLGCILSGCDYVSNLRNIGVKTAFKLVQQSSSLRELLSLLVSNFGFAEEDIFGHYRRSVLSALYCFAHHIIYDPRVHACRHLHPIDPAFANNNRSSGGGSSGSGGSSAPSHKVELLGIRFSDSVARAVCEAATHDPVTLQLYTGQYTYVLRHYLRRLSGGRLNRQLTSFAGFKDFSTPKVVVYQDSGSSGGAPGHKRPRDSGDGESGEPNMSFFSTPLEKVRQCGALRGAGARPLGGAIDSRRIVRSKYFVSRCVVLPTTSPDLCDTSSPSSSSSSADGDTGERDSQEAKAMGSAAAAAATTADHAHHQDGRKQCSGDRGGGVAHTATTTTSTATHYNNTHNSNGRDDSSSGNSGAGNDDVRGTDRSAGNDDASDAFTVDSQGRNGNARDAKQRLLPSSPTPPRHPAAPHCRPHAHSQAAAYRDMYCPSGPDTLKQFSFKPPRRTNGAATSVDTNSTAPESPSSPAVTGVTSARAQKATNGVCGRAGGDEESQPSGASSVSKKESLDSIFSQLQYKR